MMDSLNFVSKDYCIQLNLDTINKSEIVKHKTSNKVFLYQNKIFHKRQLFQVSKYQELIEYKISSFKVGAILNIDIKQAKGEGNCLNQYQKWFLHNYGKKPKLSNDQLNKSFYLDGIIISNDAKKQFRLNSIRLKFK